MYNFSSYFVQSVHGWSPGNYTVMVIVAGLVGIVGYPFAGRLADRSGRRRAGFALFASFPLLALVFYQGPGWVLPLAWVPIVFALTGGNTIAARAGRGALPDLATAAPRRAGSSSRSRRGAREGCSWSARAPRARSRSRP